MTLCVVQLTSFEELSEISEQIEIIEELYGQEYQLVYSLQGGQRLWSDLCTTLPSLKIIYLGEQKRTREEYFLFYVFSGLEPRLFYDSSISTLVELKDSHDWALCLKIKSEYDDCASLKGAETNCLSRLKATELLLEYFSGRARKICDYLKEGVYDWQELALLEMALYRGSVNRSLIQFSTDGHVKCGEINQYDILLDKYRMLGRRKGIDKDLVDERKDLLIALGSRNFSHNKISLAKYLLVHSAYSYSVSGFYGDLEADLAAVFAYRSFEFLILGISVDQGIVDYSMDRGEISFFIAGGTKKRVTGVGDVWALIENEKNLDKSISDPLWAVVRSRNKALIGHGFFHFSADLVEAALQAIYRLMVELLSDDDKSYWLRYKRLSRSVDLKKFGWSDFSQFSLI